VIFLQASTKNQLKVKDYIFRNLKSNKLRTYLTLSTVAFCVALFIIFNSVGDGLDQYTADRASETNIARYSEMAELLNAWLGIINSILVIILAVAVANTMLITITERQREIGTLKAVGITGKQIRELVLLETVTITVIAFIVGCVIGMGISATSNYFFWQSESSGAGLGLFLAPTRITVGTLIGAAGLSIIVGTLAALLPAMRAASLQPAEALRYE
jgi:putative ABC transport system permease protein